ncbi:MAG: PQQ-binding-like beta-propeller repeat protein, partial [Acidobacteria bacterium]|nr:PQQ-binding-like beta-propeller repeat protein [Acidobacteriota bacterium]
MTADLRVSRPLHIAGVAVAVLAASAVATTRQESPQDYPQWRGRDRDGAASAFTEPASWPDRLNLRWKVDVGEGYATPIVVGARVYVFARQDGKEGITALDAATGTTIWRTDYPVAFDPFEGAEDHGRGPKATPLFYREKLFTLGITGIISAFEARSGALVWQKPAPPIPQPDVGMATSPIADGDLVIVQEGYDALTAFQAETGRVRWTARDEFRYASP